jgi:hypothetical protein
MTGGRNAKQVKRIIEEEKMRAGERKEKIVKVKDA